MMKREFIRLKNKKITLIFFYVLIIGFCGVSIYISKNYTQPNSLYDYISGYTSPEDLEKYYNEVKSYFEEDAGKPMEELSYKKLDEDEMDTYRRLLVFEYILKHDVSLKDTILYSSTYTFFSKDVLGMASSYTVYFSIAIMVISVFFTIYIFNSDLWMKKQVFLYVGQDRIKILRDKFLTYVCVMLGVILLLSMLSGIYILIFADKPSEVLIIAGSRIFSMSSFQTWISEILNMTVTVMPYIICFFLIGVISKNAVLTVLLCYGLYILSYGYDNTAMTTMFGAYPLDVIGFGFSTPEKWLAYYAVELLILAILGITAHYRFKRCDLM